MPKAPQTKQKRHPRKLSAAMSKLSTSLSKLKTAMKKLSTPMSGDTHLQKTKIPRRLRPARDLYEGKSAE